MSRSRAALVLLGLLFVACGSGTFFAVSCSGKPEPSPSPAQDLGAQTGRIVNDTEVLRGAQDAVNAVVRSAPDCEAAKASMEEANRRIAEAEERIQTAAGRQTLEAMKVQVKRVAELCP